MATTYSARDLLRVPGLLTLSRLPLVVAFAVALARGERVLAIAVLGVAGLSDVLDGWYARRFHQATPTGAVLDAVMDKVFVGGVAVTLLFLHTMSLPYALLLGTRDLGELLIGLRLAIMGDRKSLQTRHERLTRQHPPNAFGKATTLMQFVAVLSAILEQPIGTAVAAALTGVLGAVATVTYYKRERETPPLS